MANVKISGLPAATDASGAELAGIQGGTTKRIPASLFLTEYMVPIWAEQNGDLLTEGTPLGFEWSFGNGATTHATNNVMTRLTLYVPTGYECHIVAMGLNAAAAATCEVQAAINGVTNSNASVSLSAGQNIMTELATPVAIGNGSNISFKTISYSSSGTTPHTVIAWLRFRKA